MCPSPPTLGHTKYPNPVNRPHTQTPVLEPGSQMDIPGPSRGTSGDQYPHPHPEPLPEADDGTYHPLPVSCSHTDHEQILIRTHLNRSVWEEVNRIIE